MDREVHSHEEKEKQKAHKKQGFSFPECSCPSLLFIAITDIVDRVIRSEGLSGRAVLEDGKPRHADPAAASANSLLVHQTRHEMRESTES